MVVVINQNSASASEIVSAALQDHKRAVIVGQRSYGKGSVQNIIDLDGGNSVLKLTVASYYRPSGENIHRFKNAKTSDKWGVSPDPGAEVKLRHQRVHPLVPGPARSRPGSRRQGSSQEGRLRRSTPRKPSRPSDEKAQAKSRSEEAKDKKSRKKPAAKTKSARRLGRPVHR